VHLFNEVVSILERLAKVRDRGLDLFEGGGAVALAGSAKDGKVLFVLARTAAIVWLAVYVVVPLAMTALLPAQVRAAGGDPPRGRALATWLRAVLSVQGGLMLLAGTALYLAPDATAGWWPWELSPLTARSVAAWLVALGAAAVIAIRDDDLALLNRPMVAYAVFGAFQLGALLRFPDQLREDAPSVWIYVAVVVSVLLTGLYGMYATRRVMTRVFPEPGPASTKSGPL
jgi:hypothetical protein